MFFLARYGIIGRTMKNKEPIYKAAVVGCGRIGVLDDLDPLKLRPASHAGAFFFDRRFELAALCDTNGIALARAGKIFPAARLYADIREMMRKEKPDVVAVAVPVERHWNVVHEAVLGGARLVICEKPFAAAAAAGRKIIAFCRRRGAMLLVNHMRRFDRLLSQTAADIQRGRYGKIKQVRALYVNGWQNSGTHLIDLLRWSLGEADWISAHKNPSFSFAHRGDFNLDAIIETRSGARIIFQSLERNDYGIFEVEFYGSKGMVAVRDLGFAVESVPLCESRRYSGTKALDFDGRKIAKNEKTSFMAAMARHAADCLDGSAKPLATGEDALAALRILTAGRKSAAAGGRKIFI